MTNERGIPRGIRFSWKCFQQVHRNDHGPAKRYVAFWQAKSHPDGDIFGRECDDHAEAVEKGIRVKQKIKEGS
jgi:hypothetical protein